MDNLMSEITRSEVLAKRRERYARAGKATIRARWPWPVVSAPIVRGRPGEYDPERLLPPLRAIWLAALQPCGERLKACLPDWLPARQSPAGRDPDPHRVGGKHAGLPGGGHGGPVRRRAGRPPRLDA